MKSVKCFVLQKVWSWRAAPKETIPLKNHNWCPSELFSDRYNPPPLSPLQTLVPENSKNILFLSLDIRVNIYRIDCGIPFSYPTQKLPSFKKMSKNEGSSLMHSRSDLIGTRASSRWSECLAFSVFPHPTTWKKSWTILTWNVRIFWIYENETHISESVGELRFIRIVRVDANRLYEFGQCDFWG